MRHALWAVWFLLFSLPFETLNAKPHTGAPPPAPVVIAKSIQATEVFDSLIYPARVVSKVNAALLAESDGVVQSISKPLGTSVVRGNTVLTLINPDPVYTFAPFEVHSPVSGVVSAIEVTKGSRVSRGQRLGTITDPRQVRAQIEVTVADLDAVQVGMKGELELSEHSKPVEMIVSGISPLIDPSTGTASAELHVVGTDKLPPPGVVGRIRFRARAHEGIQLPESAIFYRGEDPLVRVLIDGKVQFRPIKLGPSRRGKFEILDGVKSGETVVLRSNTFTADGEEVSVQKDGM